MESSRLSRVKTKKATRQAFLYMIVSMIIIVAMVIWGVPAAARLAGLLITKDTGVSGIQEIRPTPPIFSDVPEATHSASISLNGFAQPGVEVVLYLNGSENKKILTDDSGIFEFRDVPIDEGENKIYAFAQSPRGQESEQSKEYSITVDKKAPEITLTSPEDGRIYRGNNERIAEFDGIVSEEGSRVTVGDRVAIVQTDGSFKLSYQLAEGDQEITVRAEDKAGNVTEKKLNLRWEP